jgi:RNA polymerase sigma factor (sigma-70 family)
MIDDKTIQELWDMVFNISLSMLHDEKDSEDATQDIMLKILENYKNFEKRSTIKTWSYSIARNYLLDYRKKNQLGNISFELFEKNIQSFKPYEGELGLSRVEERLYIEEIKTGCTLAMLQCLDAESRFVFILGNIYYLKGKEAAQICNLSETVYRKKLSRSKEKIRNFMSKNCGLLNEDAFCKCRKRLLIAQERGRIKEDRIVNPHKNKKIRDYLQEMNSIASESAIYLDNPFFENIRDRFSILHQQDGQLTL